MLNRFSKLIFAGSYNPGDIPDGSSIMNESFFTNIGYKDNTVIGIDAGVNFFKTGIVVSVELCLYCAGVGGADDVYLVNKYIPADEFNSFKNIVQNIGLANQYRFWKGDFIVYPESTLILQSKTTPSIITDIRTQANIFGSDSTLIIYQKL